MFDPTAWLALIAVVENPITLHDELVSEDTASGKTAWESELESLKNKGSWVIASVPKN